jgi:transcriptional regulator with XRE-family HTH domain
MITPSEQNAIIARNIVFWRGMHDLTPQGAVRRTNISVEKLAAYEAGKEPVLAVDLFALAAAWGVPVYLFPLDHGEDFYNDVESSELKYEIWSLVEYLEDHNELERASLALRTMHYKNCRPKRKV